MAIYKSHLPYGIDFEDIMESRRAAKTQDCGGLLVGVQPQLQ